MEGGDTRILEALDESRFVGIRECGFPDEHESEVFCFCAGLNDEFSSVACASDDQNPAFLSH